jgi:hypothetical protein
MSMMGFIIFSAPGLSASGRALYISTIWDAQIKPAFIFSLWENAVIASEICIDVIPFNGLYGNLPTEAVPQSRMG